MKKVILYTTSGCHLCELAEQMLETLQAEGACEWHPIEISDDDYLIEKYGVRIPVIYKTSGCCSNKDANKDASKEEMGWPFSLELLREWL